ncbi:MAG TPA: thioredoxin family protein [Puia sp.]|nr:thioredoxin family protein [Puia sp.]
MKKLLIPLLLLPALGLLSFYGLPDNSLPIGSPIPKPTIRVKDVSGKEVSLQEAKQDGGLLVMFSCNTCPYVIRNQSRTKEVCAYAKAHQIGVILLNANEGDRNGGNSYESMQAYAKEQGYQWPYAVDRNSELADAFGASRTPECYLFDKSGKLVYHGAIDDSPGDAGSVKRHHLREAIDEMNGGKEVTVKETRSVGCSIARN